MLRRDLGKASLGLMVSSALSVSTKRAEHSGAEFPKTSGLTGYVGRFVTTTTYEQIPEEVVELGKKSILDGLGLALAGSRAETGSISRKYIQQMGVCNGKATVIGSAQKSSPRFAALVNGISIHADDFELLPICRPCHRWCQPRRRDRN